MSADDRAAILRRVAAEHGVAIDVPDVESGPTVTAFGVVPGAGVAPAAVGKLTDAWSLAVGEPVRYVGASGARLVVEVPNAVRRTVRLHEVMPNLDVHPDAYALAVPFGIKATGGQLSILLDALPHLLVAGTTGSGKSVYVNALLVALLRQAGPDRLRLMLADPKRVELAPYAPLPHLARPIATDHLDIVDMLRAAVAEMEERYATMEAAGVRHVRHLPAPPPRLVVVVDELADVMLSAKKQAEPLIQSLAQKARAAGIHLVLATQRPSVDVVTGIIKTNIPTRVAFSVTSMTDSRVVLDANGAEALVGDGDGLAMLPRQRGLTRFQAPYVDDDEIAAAVEVWRPEEPDGTLPAVDPSPLVEQRDAAIGELVEATILEHSGREVRRLVAPAPPAPRCEHSIHDVLAAELTEKTRRSALDLDDRMTKLTVALAAIVEMLTERGLPVPDEVKEVLA